MFDEMRINSVKGELVNTVNAIEAYKSRYGSYPQNITFLSAIGNDIRYTYQLQVAELGKQKDSYFYYENHGDSYILFSRGIDGKPFTEDDVFPDQKFLDGNIGYKSP